MHEFVKPVMWYFAFDLLLLVRDSQIDVMILVSDVQIVSVIR
jgi:hypothetical protein